MIRKSMLLCRVHAGAATFAPLLLLLTACPPIESPPDGQVPVDGGSGADRAAADSAAGDQAVSDRALADRAASDVARDAAHDASAVAAVPGARCPLRQRLGQIQVSGNSGSYSVWGQLFDRPDPRLGDYALSDQACGFHEATPAMECGTCEIDQVCSFDRVCAGAALPVFDADLVLAVSGQQQHFAPDQTMGNIYGAITLAGSSFSLRLAWADQVVTLVESAVPTELTNLSGTMSGDYMSPTAVDISWTPPVDAASVYTLVPINHHAGGMTFTECLVDAATGALHIDGAMLQPLAVSTGLEFQGVQHTRFAAASTAAGCVEIRYEVQHYVSLY